MKKDFSPLGLVLLNMSLVDDLPNAESTQRDRKVCTGKQLLQKDLNLQHLDLNTNMIVIIMIKLYIQLE